VPAPVEIQLIRDRNTIEKFLRDDSFMHLYSLGDLDDFFWPDTKWIALRSDVEIISIILLYQDIRKSVVLALNHRRSGINVKSFPSLKPFLPDSLNGHLTYDFMQLLSRDYHINSSGVHYKMGLINPSLIHIRDTSGASRLTIQDRDELLALYEHSYPENWFNERMLLTGHYYGIKKDGQLVSVAGVHVYSEKYKVAALGNITTHPSFRNRGYGEIVTAHLCQMLFHKVDHIGLNVHSENLSAIRCYQKLGFEIRGKYEECSLIRRTS
jgi:RimJ/RimL family protein N-acetyltransferase